jgi:hypothetical protein
MSQAGPSAPGCDAPETQPVPTPDEPTTRQLVTGTWQLCEPPSFFGTTDEVGLVIAADGHWAKLSSDGTGTAVEMAGAENRGTWDLVDTSAMNGPGTFQVDFTFVGGGFAPASLRFFAPAKLVLDTARYVRATIPVLPPPPGGSGCDAPEIENVPTPDEATTRRLLIGKWSLCDTPSFFGSTDEIGLLIADDGHWAKLASDGAGGTLEMEGAANRGMWELVDTSVMNGPGHFQINFTGLDGGIRMSAVVIIAPAKLRLSNEGVFVARYVRPPTLVATR